jgi:zeaxanthin glucosyltransferase
VAAMASICRELEARGHRTILFRFPGVLDERPAEGLTFHPLDAPDPGFMADYEAALSTREGVQLKAFLDYMTARARFVFAHGPKALTDAKLDAVLVDMADPAPATVAEKLGLPFVSIGNALPSTGDPRVPPDFRPWLHHNSTWARLRNGVLYRIRDWMIRPVHQVLNEGRREWG